MMTNIILESIEVDKKIVFYNISVSSEIDYYFSTKRMFLEYPEDMSNVPMSILTIPFVATFIGLAWLENANIYVDELDSTYYHSLREVREAYRDMYYNANLRGRVVPCKIIENQIEKRRDSLLLFGGGVDAHCSFLRNSDSITRIMNIQGRLQSFATDSKDAIADRDHCAEYAKKMNVKFDYVRSNFALVVRSKPFNKRYGKVLGDQWWHGILHSMAFISIAIPMAYNHKISQIMIASSCTKGRIKPCGSFITTDSSFRYASKGGVIHDAFELNRQQKVQLIVDYQKKKGTSYPLKVCSYNDCNCTECEKCFRTIIEIVAEGGDPRNFGFDINQPLLSFFNNLMHKRLGLWGINFEREIYWKSTIMRMKENYDKIIEKDFVDYFVSYDFDKQYWKSRINYYFTNFSAIVKRKINYK